MQRNPRRQALMVATLLLGLTATGCSSLVPGSGLPAASVLPERAASTDEAAAQLFDFAYTAVGEPGMMDQILDIHSSATEPVLLTFDVVAVDADGNPQDGLEVGTVFGSDVAGMIVMPGANFDIVRFDAVNGGSTTELRVDVTSVVPAQVPAVTGWVDVVPTEGDGTENRDPGRFTEFVLTSHNEASATICTVYLVWGATGPAESQQVEDVRTLLPSTVVEADSRTVVPASEELLDELAEFNGYAGGSFNAYFCPTDTTAGS